MDGSVILNQKGENSVKKFTETSRIPVYAVAPIREMLDYLYEEKVPVTIEGEKRPIDERVKGQFDEYIRIYGQD